MEINPNFRGMKGGEEGGKKKKKMPLILLKTDPRPWRYCVRIFEPPQRRERDNRRRSLRKWIWHDCVFIAHRVKKGNSGKLQMAADFCNNSAKSLSSASGKKKSAIICGFYCTSQAKCFKPQRMCDYLADPKTFLCLPINC